MGIFTRWRASAVPSLWAPECLVCQANPAVPAFAETEATTCAACWSGMPWLDPAQACPVCAEPDVGGLRCGRCLRAPPPYERTLAGVVYRSPADAILRRFKYGADFSLAPLAAAMLRAALTTAPLPDVILPAPMHAAKLRQRGFNQASEVARRVGRALAIQVNTTQLVRCRPTLPQAGLDRQQRLANVRGAFAVRAPLRGHVAVLDDVMTSGSTAAAMASAVRGAGADSVSVWVVMRTPSAPG